MASDALDRMSPEAITNRRIGVMLRQVRKERRWSQHEVEVVTDGEFKASILGAYERGERSMSIHRLLRLANFYDVSPAQILGLEPPSPDELKRHAQEFAARAQEFAAKFPLDQFGTQAL